VLSCRALTPYWGQSVAGAGGAVMSANTTAVGSAKRTSLLAMTPTGTETTLLVGDVIGDIEGSLDSSWVEALIRLAV
jgi:hypothetical protein